MAKNRSESKAAKGARPARMPARPKAPDPSVEPEVPLVPGDTDERRAAARVHLDAERAAARAGLEIPDLPCTSSDAR